MAHQKIRAAAAFIAILSIVLGISWAIVTAKLAQANEQQPQPAAPKIATQEDIRDAAIAYIKANHADANQFLNNLTWTGGRQNTNLLGAETYTWQSQGWNITIHYPVVADPVYNIAADYSAQTSGSTGAPYRVVWEGTWQSGTLTETNYTFSQ